MMRTLALLTLWMMAATSAAFNASALPPIQKHYPTYVYPSDLDLSRSFSVYVKKGRDLLLPFAPLHHVLFPEVDPGGNFSLGVSLSACAGSMYASIVTADSVVYPLSTAPDQCYTFVKESPVLPSAQPSLCPQYRGPDDCFYTLDPYKIEGVLVMADLDEDLHVHVSFSSSHTFPRGYPRMLKAESPLNMTLDASSSTMSFEFPTVVTTALNESACPDCTYDVYFSPPSSAFAAPVPPTCLHASNVGRVPLHLSGDRSGHITDLHRAFDEGVYLVYLMATLPGTSRSAMLLYTPMTAFITRSMSWTSVVMLCAAAVAAVGLLWLGVTRFRRRQRMHRPSTPHLPVPFAAAPYGTPDETAGLLSKDSAYLPLDDQDSDDDDCDPRLAGYQNIDPGHVTV